MKGETSSPQIKSPRLKYFNYNNIIQIQIDVYSKKIYLLLFDNEWLVMYLKIYYDLAKRMIRWFKKLNDEEKK